MKTCNDLLLKNIYFPSFLFVLKVIVKQAYNFIQTDHKNLTHIFVVSISCKILNKLNLLTYYCFPGL